jgi:uncharacterized membrane protein
LWAGGASPDVTGAGREGDTRISQGWICVRNCLRRIVQYDEEATRGVVKEIESIQVHMASAKREQSEIPPGWDYNPSTWRERGPLLALAGVGLIISCSLALYQFGVLPEPWDPIFGAASSASVLHSPISAMLPVPDASLGALAYAAEIGVGVIGGEARWRTRPGVVLLFGLIVLGLGLVSMLLLILQGAVVHSWCALCLVSAAISIFLLSMVPGEVLAAAQAIRRSQADGVSLRLALLGSSL